MLCAQNRHMGFRNQCLKLSPTPKQLCRARLCLSIKLQVRLHQDHMYSCTVPPSPDHVLHPAPQAALRACASAPRPPLAAVRREPPCWRSLKR